MKSWRSLSAKAILLGALLGAAPLVAAPLNRTGAEIAVAGAGWAGAQLRRAIPLYLSQELASNPVEAPAGARIVVRVTEIFLSSDFAAYNDGPAMMDALDGEVLLLDARGAVLARKSVAGRMNPETGPMGEPREARRIDALAQSIAYWAVRALR